MMKIFEEVLKGYILGLSNFSFISSWEDGFKYPIDLDFTLKEESKYYSPKDGVGLPIKNYKSVGLQYNPTRIAAYGLAHWNRIDFDGLDCDRGKRACAEFMNVASWFKESGDGRYSYEFDWDGNVAPWISCMAQGEAASVLSRAYYYTQDRSYLDAAKRALEPFFFDISCGGVRSLLKDGSPFLEEYPVGDNKNVLNGFMYSLIGLNDYCKVTGSKEHEELFDLLICTLCENIDLWDAGGWSLYGPSPEGVKVKNYCTSDYHALHIAQVKWVCSVKPSDSLEALITRWEQGQNDLFWRFRALINKVAFRLAKPAQR